MPDNDTAQTILALEKEAFRRWADGDVEGFLEITDPDVAYFDPFLENRLDGLDALRSLYHQIQEFKIERYEIIDPRVQVIGDAAVLTFRFESHSNLGFASWNTTEVYRRTPEGWRIIHTHWAFNKAGVASAAA